MSEINAEFDCEVSGVDSGVSWTKTQFDPDFIVGDEVNDQLRIDDCYSCCSLCLIRSVINPV